MEKQSKVNRILPTTKEELPRSVYWGNEKMTRKILTQFEKFSSINERVVKVSFPNFFPVAQLIISRNLRTNTEFLGIRRGDQVKIIASGANLTKTEADLLDSLALAYGVEKNRTEKEQVLGAATKEISIKIPSGAKIYPINMASEMATVDSETAKNNSTGGQIVICNNSAVANESGKTKEAVVVEVINAHEPTVLNISRERTAVMAQLEQKVVVMGEDVNVLGEANDDEILQKKRKLGFSKLLDGFRPSLANCMDFGDKTFLDDSSKTTNAKEVIDTYPGTMVESLAPSFAEEVTSFWLPAATAHEMEVDTLKELPEKNQLTGNIDRKNENCATTVSLMPSEARIGQGRPRKNPFIESGNAEATEGISLSKRRRRSSERRASQTGDKSDCEQSLEQTAIVGQSRGTAKHGSGSPQKVCISSNDGERGKDVLLKEAEPKPFITSNKRKRGRPRIFQNILVCKFCGKIFTKLANRQRHECERHGTAKSYECNQCGKLFKRHHDKNRHQSTCKLKRAENK